MENTSNTFFRQLLTELIQSRVSGKTISEDDFVEKLLHGISVHGVGGCDDLVQRLQLLENFSRYFMFAFDACDSYRRYCELLEKINEME